MKLHHIGIIVKDIEKSIKIYSEMGYIQTGEVVIDEIQNNRVVFMEHPQASLVEFVEPIDSSSSISNFKVGYHHLCFEEEKNENIRDYFGKARIGKIFTKPMIAPALDYREIIFAYLRNGTLIEIVLIGKQC